MYALLITVIVYGSGGSILSAATTSIPGYESRSACEQIARTVEFTEANSKRFASCIPVTGR